VGFAPKILDKKVLDGKGTHRHTAAIDNLARELDRQPLLPTAPAVEKRKRLVRPASDGGFLRLWGQKQSVEVVYN